MADPNTFNINPEFTVEDALSMAKNIRESTSQARKVYEQDALFIAALKLAEEVQRLRGMTAVSMGVGDGRGRLFVHGDYDSIKAAQRLVFRAVAATRASALVSAWRNSRIDCWTCANQLEEALRDR